MKSTTMTKPVGRRQVAADEGWYELVTLPEAGAFGQSRDQQSRSRSGYRRPLGPATYTWGAKTVTSALAITSAIGLWNGIGHLEAGRAAQQIAYAAQVQGVVSEAVAAPAVPLLQIPPIPTLTVDLSGVDAALAQGVDQGVQIVLPSSPAAVVPPALEALPALPDVPSQPAVEAVPTAVSQPVQSAPVVQSAPQVSRRSRGS